MNSPLRNLGTGAGEFSQGVEQPNMKTIIWILRTHVNEVGRSYMSQHITQKMISAIDPYATHKQTYPYILVCVHTKHTSTPIYTLHMHTTHKSKHIQYIHAYHIHK